MFRIRPFPKVFTPDELACCSVNGRTVAEYAEPNGLPYVPAIEAPDGVWNTYYDLVDNLPQMGKIAFTICCASSVEIAFIPTDTSPAAGEYISVAIAGLPTGGDFAQLIPSGDSVSGDIATAPCDGVVVEIEWDGAWAITLTLNP